MFDGDLGRNANREYITIYRGLGFMVMTIILTILDISHPCYL